MREERKRDAMRWTEWPSTILIVLEVVVVVVVDGRRRSALLDDCSSSRRLNAIVRNRYDRQRNKAIARCDMIIPHCGMMYVLK